MAPAGLCRSCYRERSGVTKTIVMSRLHTESGRTLLSLSVGEDLVIRSSSPSPDFPHGTVRPATVVPAPQGESAALMVAVGVPAANPGPNSSPGYCSCDALHGPDQGCITLDRIMSERAPMQSLDLLWQTAVATRGGPGVRSGASSRMYQPVMRLCVAAPWAGFL